MNREGNKLFNNLYDTLWIGKETNYLIIYTSLNE